MKEVIEFPKYMFYTCRCGKAYNGDGTPLETPWLDDRPLTTPMSLGEVMRHQRFILGVSQEKLANSIGTTRQTIMSIESDRTSPRFPLAQKIAKCLCFSLDDLSIHHS